MLHETLNRALPLERSFNPWVVGSIPTGPTWGNSSFQVTELHQI